MKVETKRSQPRPPAGLSLAEWAKVGLGSAQEKVVNQKPPAGLSLAEWADLGLESAQEKRDMLSAKS